MLVLTAGPVDGKGHENGLKTWGRWGGGCEKDMDVCDFDMRFLHCQSLHH